MQKLLVKLFIKDYKNTSDIKVRSKYGTLSGIVGIITNILLCSFKITLGIITASQSILADGINNLTDAGSSIITLVGFKLSSAPPDKDHPYGHERIEYVTGLLISIIILIIGYTIGKDSVINIIENKAPTDFSIIAILAMGFSILVKCWQSVFYRKMAKEINSDSLIASSNDSLNDCISTTSVIIGLILFKLFKIVWIDSAIGILVAIFIVVSGIKMIFETISPLIGSMPSQDEIDRINKKILNYDGVLGIHDLVIHRYGACTIFASVHIEVDAKVDVMESHDMIDNIEKAVKNELNVNLTAHLDPIDVGNPETLRLKAIVLEIVKNISLDISIHDFRVVHGTTHTNILFDVAIPCKFKYSHDELRNILNDEIKKIGDNYIAIINIDQLYVTSVEKN